MTSAPRRPVARLKDDGALQIDYAGAKRYFGIHGWRLSGPTEDRPWYENTAVYLRGKVLWKRFGRPSAQDPNVNFGWPYMAGFAEDYSTSGKSVQDYQGLWQEGWDVTRAIIRAMRDHVKALGAQFAISNIPSDYQLTPAKQRSVAEAYPLIRFDPQRINRELEAFGKETAIPVLDSLGPLLAARKRGETDLNYTLFDSHMKPKTHKILAKDLAEQLLARGLVPGD